MGSWASGNIIISCMTAVGNIYYNMESFSFDDLTHLNMMIYCLGPKYNHGTCISVAVKRRVRQCITVWTGRRGNCPVGQEPVA